MKIALFYNPQSFDAPPQGTHANIPNVPYISRNQNHPSAFSRWQFVFTSIFIRFLPRDASAQRGDATVNCLSVCPSVCP